MNLLADPPAGFRVEPVYVGAHGDGYLYARRFTLKCLDCPDDALQDQPLNAYPGDILLGLAPQREISPSQTEHIACLRRAGVKIQFVVCDLLPALLPHHFTDASRDATMQWLHTVQQGDGAICLSRAVADEFFDWLTVFGGDRTRPFQINWVHLGAPPACVPSRGDQQDRGPVRRSAAYPSFLMVGTIEHRTGHAQTLAAFERLWHSGIDARLVIAGSPGWMVNSLKQEFSYHRETGRRLFWLETVTDSQLAELYDSSTCLLIASEGEGYSLPLLEAARHHLPIIARDIPVFRELAGEQAHYFSGLSPSSLADALQRGRN